MTLREIENQKPYKNNNKFITTTVDDTTISAQSENSFLVKNIIPRKIMITQENKNTQFNFSELNKEKNCFLKTLFRPENKENLHENYKNMKTDDKINEFPQIQRASGDRVVQNINLEKYKTKLMLVYFNSIKNLCKYINKHFFDFEGNENMMVDTFLSQVYQTFRILNQKINEFKIFIYMKEILKAKIKEEDFAEIIALKQNLQFMKNILNKTMSENLINIYMNLENFCKVFYKV